MVSSSLVFCTSVTAKAAVSRRSSSQREQRAAIIATRHCAKRGGLVTAASKANGNGGTPHAHDEQAGQLPSHDERQVSQMVNLVQDYFGEFMSNGNMEAAQRVLDSHVEHKDMVRDIGNNGMKAVQDHVRRLKQDHPKLYVKATQFGVASPHTLFVAFEGRADEHSPLFKGVNLFGFNDRATKIKEIQVYRSNWMGAKGHEERKRAAQAHAGSLTT